MIRALRLGNEGHSWHRLAVTAVLTTAWVSPRGANAQDKPVVFRISDATATYPHDPTAFTQGLEVDSATSVIYESTGLYGESSLRRGELGTGQVLTQIDLSPSHFGEGLTQVGNTLIQLTWNAGLAFVYDKNTLKRVDEFLYTGEGWGLCHDKGKLVMSDGSGFLSFRDPDSFAQTGTVAVVNGDTPVTYLNELECSQGVALANVWYSNTILAIDLESGQVLAQYDFSDLNPSFGENGDDVLNGIALNHDSGTVLITGKRWSTIYEFDLDDPRFDAISAWRSNLDTSLDDSPVNEASETSDVAVPSTFDSDNPSELTNQTSKELETAPHATPLQNCSGCASPPPLPQSIRATLLLIALISISRRRLRNREHLQ